MSEATPMKCSLFFALTLLLAAGAVASAVTETIVELDVAVPMRDGVVLRADIYRPAGAGPFPVLVYRTPYGKTQTGGLESVSAEMQPATIRIHHDATYPSKLLLPVIPNR